MSTEEHRQTLLCVDDEPNNLRLLELQLKDHYNVLTAGDGEEALKVMGNNAVGVVMSDERMPGMSGIDLLSKLSADYPAVGRIILSAHGEADRILRALNTGHAHEYLLKPWKLDELRTTLEQAFHAHARRQKLEASLERVESSYPFSIEEYALTTDTAGTGRQRGGAGGVVALRYRGTGSAVLNVAGEGTVIAPYGINEGTDGSPHSIWIERRGETIQLDGRSNDIPIEPGDLIVHHAAGGGGCGNPRDRERSSVKRDVDFGYISQDTARNVYHLTD